MKRFVLFAVIVAIASLPPAFSQGMRTVVSEVVALDSRAPEGTSVSIRYNQAVGVSFPADPTFIQGVEFELRIPKAFQGAESSIAWSIFSKVTPAPSIDLLDYDGDLVATQPLPARVAMNLVIPISEKHNIRSGPFASLIPLVAGADRFPLVFKLSPIGKGIKPTMESAEFKLTVRPVLLDEGGIQVKVTFPEGFDHGSASVFVDDRKAEDPHAVVLTKKGARVVRVSADGFREEVVTIAVEAGRVVAVPVTLVPNAPFIAFQAPAGTFVSIDGVIVHQSEMSGLAVEPGEHTLAFKIGDYSMTRKLMALRGKTYQVILSVELEIVTTP